MTGSTRIGSAVKRVRAGPLSAVFRCGLVLIGLALALTMAGCHKGVNPKPVRYRLFVGYSAYKGDVLVLDAGTDSLVDSVVTGSGFFNSAADEPYLSLWYGKDACFHVLETSSLTEVGHGCGWSDAYVAASENRLIAFAPASGMYGNGVIIADMSGQALAYDTLFTREEIDSARILGAEFWQINPLAGLVYGYLVYASTGERGGGDLIAYDYRRRESRIWRIRPDGPESWANWIRSFHVHPDGRRIYFATYTKSGAEILCYDLQREEVVFRAPVHSGFEWVQVTPDGSQVYVTDPGDPRADFGPTYHKIAVFNADNGSLVAEIPTDTLALRQDWPWTAVPQQIRFVPASSKAYLATGAAGPGNVIDFRLAVLDTKRQRIEEILNYKVGEIKSMVVAPVQ